MKIKYLIKRLKCFDENLDVMFANLEHVRDVGELELASGKVVILSDVEDNGDEDEE